MSEPGLIYKKLSAVMGEIGHISKDRKNAAQGYAFRGIDDIYNAVNGALFKHGLFCVPKVLKSERSERTSNSGSVLLYSIVEMQYTFFAEDGSHVEVCTVGEGMDSGDKATNKAMSAAQKYAFLQLFCIPTEEVKDSEEDSPEVGASKNAPKPPAAQPEQKEAAKLISDKQRNRLYAIASACEIPEEAVKKILTEYGYKSSTEIEWPKYNEIVRRVQDWSNKNGLS